MNIKYKFFITAIFLAVIWLGLIFFLTTSHFKFSPLKISRIFTREQVLLVPQGWGFFTRNPREDLYVVYKKNTQNDYEKFIDVNFTFANSLGLSRQNRIQYNEVLYSIDINDSLWLKTRLEYNEVKLDTIFKLENAFQNPSICGEYLIKKEEPLPWAWRKSINKIKQDKKYILIDVICGDLNNK